MLYNYNIRNKGVITQWKKNIIIAFILSVLLLTSGCESKKNGLITGKTYESITKEQYYLYDDNGEIYATFNDWSITKIEGNTSQGTIEYMIKASKMEDPRKPTIKKTFYCICANKDKNCTCNYYK